MFAAEDLKRVAAEASPALVGGTVRAVRPRGREGFYLAVRGAAETRWLLVGLEPRLARAHLVAERPPEEKLTTPFHDQLRARLEGAAVTALEAIEGDRVLRIELARDAERSSLWLSFFGAHADAVLEDAKGEAVLSLREGSRRPLLTKASGPAQPAMFPDIEADPETTAYSRALAAHFEGLEAARAAEERRRSVEAELGRRRKKAAGAVVKLRAAVETTSKADEAQRAGELLLASRHLIRPHASEVEVPDYFAPDAPPRRIELDAALAPADQAERYFKLAKKSRRGAKVSADRLAAFERELAGIDRALAILAARGAAAVDEAAALAGIRLGASPRAAARKPRQEPNAGPRRFRSRDGLEILVGRSNAENDELTMRTARSNDLFFHVLGCPGSHVIVRAEKGKSVPLDTLLDAAELAIHYSKARERTRADVSYTPRKYVRKPRGSKPGLVALERSETLHVVPDGGRLARVLGTAAGRDADGQDSAAGG